MAPSFVHLRLHSEYSLSDGLVRINPLIARCRELGMPAVALTDQVNLFALIKFYRVAEADGIKPIVGADLWVRNPAAPSQPDRLTLLVQNRAGYRNLTALLSRAYLEGQHLGRAIVERDWILANAEGLLALSGGREGDVGRWLLAGKEREAARALDGWLVAFGDRFYLEIQRTGRPREEDYLEAALHLAAARDVAVVATNDVRFLTPEDFEAHEARVCIHEGWTLDDPKRPRRYSEQQYLKSPEEMAALFADLPEAVANTVEVAKRCNLELELGKPCLPLFPVPEGMTLDEFFVAESRRGLERRFESGALPRDRADAYWQRLQTEIDVIVQMGFPGYFLIVADFIQWAKANGIPVGPGRGSGAGSLVAYALGITDLDPLEFDLLFERFLNPERVSMPDFDVDFCMERRDRVIEYVAQKYGRDKVSQIITFGTMAAKAVVRDVGRVLGHSYGFVDRIAKLIPFELGMTLDKALAESEELRQAYEQDEEIRALIDLAKSLEGVARNAGKHAGGVVIAPSQLIDFTPLYREEGEEGVVTQFDKDDVEAAGLVKFDFLGLRTLTIIDWAVETVNRQRAARGEPPIDISSIPRDDSETFALLKSCRTTAVFQLESRGMKDLIRRLQPDCFEDIIALVALFRPGPLQSGMVDDYINVKHGRAKANYPHPALEPILKPTNGVILYQEQVMQIARDLAGYTLGGADLLRRAMGKKKPEEMAKQRAIFVEGATGRGVAQETAEYIFDLMEKFAGYGFNKSHSAAYAWVSYQTAWLKAHYPAAFMAAVLSSDMDNTDKLVGFVEECRQLGLTLLPPDVNHSDYRFSVRDDGAIRYGLGAVKGVGQAAIEDILAARRQGGPFKDLYDFCRRIDLRKANRRVLEALIRAGALDHLGDHRAQLLEDLGAALQAAEQYHRSAALGQNDLFGLGGEAEDIPVPSATTPVPPWPLRRQLSEEKTVLGFYLSGHPLDEYREELAHFVTAPLGRLGERCNQSGAASAEAVVAGLVAEIRTRQNKQGKRMAFLTLEDGQGRLEAAVFSEVLEGCQELLAKDAILVVKGELGRDDYSGQLRLVAEQLWTVADARAHFAKGLWLRWPEDADPREQVARLAAVLEKHKGGRCPLFIDYANAEARACLRLGQAWQVNPSDALLQELRRFWGAEAVALRYR
ncbi:DNA polymerase III subunit alpha [Methylomarinovum caldicuralii]|uniref:DNA polymerase III subunit alpha n=1 Tax=Methylomarinovum caldicuralii TaxID=438856 RepID=A0AAU9C2K7_9GAMM|nr:DNA polymerase III subunit alpha [Methylomarinovum caldicuralii]BCX82637.1 DNA polymerase III subunit alpha [Methylomarinovum caldicuralii]